MARSNTMFPPVLSGIALALALGALPFGLGQNLVAPAQSVSYRVGAAAEGGPDGVVFIADYGLGATLVVIALDGTPAGGSHPAHFHSGNCGSGGGIVVPLESVEGDTGLSVTMTDAPFATITGGDHYLNVHASAAEMGTIVACGEVGAGAEAAAGMAAATTAETTAKATAETATEPADGDAPQAEEFRSPRTASYGVFAVEGSGVSGQVQLTEEIDTGTKVVVSLDGIVAGESYRAEIKTGDCGPDGTVVLELEPIPFRPGESSGITESEVAFDALAEGDNYLNIYAPGADAVIACGEVGVGANR